MNRIIIRITPNSNITIIVNNNEEKEEIPIYYCTKNNLEIWK